LAASLLACCAHWTAAPAGSGCKRLDQPVELADGIARQNERWAAAFLRTEECSSNGWEIAATPIGQREQQMDLALDVMPPVNG
jgi:hypothetical protein